MKKIRIPNNSSWMNPCLLVPVVLQALAGLRARVYVMVND